MAKIKKVLEIIPSLGCGGAERIVVDLSNEISKSAEVTILCFHNQEGGDFFLKRVDKRVKFVSIDHRDRSSGENRLSTMLKIWRFIVELKPDVVHCHLGALPFSALAILSHIPNIPYIYTVHSDAFFDADFNLWRRKLLFRLGNVHPVTISEASRESFVRAYGFSPPLIINGVKESIPSAEALAAVKEEISSWRSSPDSLLLINVARIVPAKNQLALARAVAKVRAEGVEADVVFIGATGDGEIVREIENLNCRNVHVAGVRDDPLPYLAQADALVLSSVFEGLPITLLEALSLGVPPCVTPVGGMKNLVHDGVNGLVASGTSVDDIAALLRRFCALPREERARLGTAARKSYEPYSIEKCAASYIELMSGLK